MKKFLTIFLTLLFVSAQNFAYSLTLEDVNFIKPPSYRVGITNDIEIPLDYNVKLSKTSVKLIESDKYQDLTYADISIKRISSQISEGLQLDNEEILSDLSILWQGAASKSDTIKYTLYKLANPDKDKPDHAAVKKVLTTIASMSTLLGASTGNPLLACSSLIGGNTLGIMSQDTKSLNYKFSKVNDADMIILVRKVDELQQKIIDVYFDYMTARDVRDMTQKIAENRLANFERAQDMSNEIILVTDAYYRETLNQLVKAKWEFSDARSRLEQLVGTEALKRFEANLKSRES